MVLINGRKHACLSCIRGHRASTCSHTGRQLQLVRSKGRPSSQCSTCKEKRAKGKFHGKCECDRSSSAESTSNNEEGSNLLKTIAESPSQWEKDERGRHSLDTLMNPCRCKTTGICTCCKQESKGAQKESLKALGTSDSACCNGEDCCSDILPVLSCPKDQLKACCSRKSMEKALINKGEDTQVRLQGKLSDCQCGDNCNCPGCSNSEGKPMTASDDCPNLCTNCSACLSGFTRPSGIKAVDDWMEKDKKAAMLADEDSISSPLKKSRLDQGFNNLTRSTATPPLPPFPQAATFFSTHFLDKERRTFFSNQMQQPADMHEGIPIANGIEEPMYGQRNAGETDEEWQIRHGYYYLTPESVEIFDRARLFKETREAREEEEEKERLRLEGSVTPAETTISFQISHRSELEELRRRALSARKASLPTQT